jgi:putative Holliday junction resolvase
MRERRRAEGQGLRAGERDQTVADAAPSSQPSALSPRVITNVIGFDFGARRIGAAIGNVISRSARAIGVVANSEQGPDWPRLDALLREWRPDTLLVGLPLMLDDSEQRASRAARAFAGDLEQRYHVPVILVDERHSSQEAAQRFAARRAGGAARRKHAATLDAVAAEIIVERWLEQA